MPVVVSNASPLINLAAIGRFHLLRVFYGQILVPQAVWTEVAIHGRGQPGASELREARMAGWVEVQSVSAESSVLSLKRELHLGEAEAIALAMERKADLILLDEADARAAAAAAGLRTTGVVGILLRAKLEGKLPALRPELDRLRRHAGFWLSDRVYQLALAASGERVE